jgi:hypothetical protein
MIEGERRRALSVPLKADRASGALRVAPGVDELSLLTLLGIV